MIAEIAVLSSSEGYLSDTFCSSRGNEMACIQLPRCSAKSCAWKESCPPKMTGAHIIMPNRRAVSAIRLDLTSAWRSLPYGQEYSSACVRFPVCLERFLSYSSSPWTTDRLHMSAIPASIKEGLRGVCKTSRLQSPRRKIKSAWLGMYRLHPK